MIAAWIQYALGLALLIIFFMCGLIIGRMQAEDEFKRNKNGVALPVTLDDLMKGNAR